MNVASGIGVAVRRFSPRRSTADCFTTTLVVNVVVSCVFISPLSRCIGFVAAFGFFVSSCEKALSAVVVDEMHLIGDPARGFLLELMLAKERLLCPKSVQARRPWWHIRLALVPSAR